MFKGVSLMAPVTLCEIFDYFIAEKIGFEERGI